jgi:DNA-binding response OmpR family regulator/nitrogen-specific signal transduction histidine kinase
MHTGGLASEWEALDDAYRTFLNLVTAQIAASLVGVAAYQGLVELDNAKTAFFSNVSHEFRTPLTLLLGPLQQVVDRAENPLGAADHEALKVAERNALRLQKLVNSLLDFSRIEAGRVQAVYEPTDLAALTADLAGSFRSAIERAGMRLLVDCPPLAAPVYVDREMWEKIVLNLLSNAFKYTFQGEIRVSLRQTEGAVEFSVGDTGVGIPETDLPRLFERFHRVEGVYGRTMEGTGIGLALVQELVKLHGGSIQVTSSPGRGSIFTVSIPLGKDHLPVDRVGGVRSLASTATGATAFLEEALRWLPSEATEQGSAIRPGLTEEITPLPSDSLLEREGLAGKARILLADDNADMRDYIRRLLNQQYEVTTVEDGEAALAAIHRSPPDLVLTDVMMPGLDGFGLLKAIRCDAKTSAIPVIILSARAGEDSKVEGLERGADDYLVKPFSARELTARVAAHVTMAELRKEVAERKVQAAKAAELAKMNKALRAEVTERKRLEQELKHQRDRLRLLLDLNNRVVSNLDLRQLFQVSSTELRRIMECDFVGLALPESGGKQLRQHLFEYSQGQGSMYEGRLIPVEGSSSGVAFRNAKPFILQSAEQAREDLEICGEPGGEAFDHRVLAEGFQSGCFLPLISRNHVLGVLQLTRQEEHAFDQQDVDFLSQIASQIAIAVDNALNYKQLTEAKARLAEEKLYLEEEIQKEYNFEEIVGNSPSLLQLLEQLALAAPTDSSVLISGETGTGKRVDRARHSRTRLAQG